jgi:dienelactone hydrolase
MNRQLRNIFLSICIILLTIGCIEQKQDTQTDTNTEENTKPSVVYRVPGMENVIIKKDIEYFAEQGTSLTVDMYYPPGFKFGSNLPAVLEVFGYSNEATKKLAGGRLKDWSWPRSWGKLIAASGMMALIYETDSPEKDLNILLQFLQDRADEFCIDRNRIGIYSCSANVPTALVNCMDETKKYFRCAVFYYGFFLMTGQKNIQEIEALSEQMGFSVPKLNAESKLRDDLPLLIVRAGLDNVPHLNSTIDHFISRAVSQNLQINFINYPEGQHGFDAYDDNDQSREIIKKTIDFWKFHLFKQ